MGLVIGISGIILALALVLGEQAQFIDRLKLIGHRTLYVYTDKGTLPAISAEGLNSSFPEISNAAILGEARRVVNSTNGGFRRNLPVLGVPPDYFKIVSGLKVRGRDISEADLRLGNPVCIIGEGLHEAMGQPDTIFLGTTAIKVIGIINAAAGDGADTGIAAADPGGAVIVPSSLSLVNPLNSDVKQRLLIQAEEGTDLKLLRTRLTGFLSSRSTAEFQVKTSEDLLERYKSTKQHLTLMIISMSCLALVLGGVGIMNNMFSMILERLPEIAIRISMGATRWDIVVQFICETLVVTVTGALAGMLVGLPVVAIFAMIDVVPVSMRWWVPVVPPLIGVVIGVICGAIPASRASRYRPIETLTFR